MGVNKATKKMARKGHLKNTIHARRKHKRISGRRQPLKGSRAPNIVKAGDEFRKEGGTKKKKKGAFDDMDAEEFLQGGFEEDDDELGDDDIDDDDEVMEGDDDEGDIELPDLSDGEDDGSGPEQEELEEDDDAEEDDNDAAADPVVKDNRRLTGEVARHRAQLEALREKDPEFYQYLKEADAELLGFGAGDEDDSEGGDEDEDEEQDDEEEEAEPKKAKNKEAKGKKAAAAGEEAEEADEQEPESSGRLDVTSALVARWGSAARGGPEGRDPPALGSFGFLVRAYRLACHYGDPQEDADSGRLRITSSAVYNSIMMFMLREADGILRRLLGLPPADSAAQQPPADLMKNSRWRKVGPLVKSFWGNSVHLLGTITDTGLLAFTLGRLRASVSLLAPFPRLRDRFLRTCLGVFGSGEVAPRLQAFLAIRAMAVSLPQPALDNCLKGLYRTFVSNCKFVSSASAPHIAFMSTCVVELWGLDMAASYQHAFTAVRQLAQLMRTALTSKTADSYKAVYCWQTVNCLELWSRVLGAHSDRPELRPLVYPVVQLLLGAARLVPTPRYFPLRLRLARALNKLATQAGVFVPVAPLALEALGWADLRRPPGGAGGGGKGAASVSGGCPDLALQLKLGKQLLRSPAVQEEVVTQVLELLCEHLACWSCSIAFPELAHVPQLHLRKFIKGCNVERFRRAAKQLLDAIQRNVTWVGAARDRVDFGPKDTAKVQAFLREEREAGRSPLQQLNAAMATRAVQRAAARRAEDVELGGVGRKRSRPDDEEEEEMAAAGGSEPATESEDDEEAAARGRGQGAAQQAARRQRLTEGVDVNGDVGGEDLLEDYVPSDDEDEDEVIEGGSGSDGMDDDEDEDEDEGEGEEEADGRGGRGPLDDEGEGTEGASDGEDEPRAGGRGSTGRGAGRKGAGGGGGRGAFSRKGGSGRGQAQVRGRVGSRGGGRGGGRAGGRGKGGRRGRGGGRSRGRGGR